MSIVRTSSLAILAWGSLATALAIKQRGIGFSTDCDAAREPDWNDCQGVFDTLNGISGGDPNYLFTFGGFPQADSQVYTQGTCALSITSTDGQSVPNSYVVDAINDLQSDCEVHSAGGAATLQPGNTYNMAVSIFSADQNPAKKSKRDQTWTNAYTIDNVAPDQYKQQVLNAQPGGSSWQLSESETQSNTVQASVSITEDLFDLFSSTQSVSYEYSHSVTEMSSSLIQNNCASGQSGTLYWYPLFTQYHGGFSDPGPSPLDIYVPIEESDGSAAGKYTVICSG